MSSGRTALPVLSPAGEFASPTRISSRSPPPPAPIIHRRPRRVQREAERCTIASPPLLLKQRKPYVTISAPLKPLRRNESVALFLRDPYQAAVGRERAASVAAALEYAFWATKTANAEGVELKMEDFLVDMTGAKLAKINIPL